MAPSQQNSVTESASKRQPDWNEFYKNGIPKEIIVIDDDSPEPQYPAATSNTSNRQPRADASNYSTHGGRKRKAEQGYEIEFSDSPTFSTHPAKFGGSSSSASYQSGDRTTSLQTVTAPTSLESYAGNNASSSYEDVRAGQKRKRIQPQKETRAQTKRKQQESTSDAFADYIPPSKPLRKAGDVHVPVIRDVCCADRPSTPLADQKQNLHKHQKVDDDDGHYIVSPNVPLTDRCMPISFAQAVAFH